MHPEGVCHGVQAAAFADRDLIREEVLIDDIAVGACEVNIAFGLVTGFLPTDLCMLLLFHSRYNDDAVRNFLFWLHMHSAKSLWRPTFNATKETHPSASTPLSPPRTRPISLAPTDPSIEIPDDPFWQVDVLLGCLIKTR